MSRSERSRFLSGIARLFRARRRGAGGIEFAISAPVIMGFILAAADLGRFVANLHRVTSASAVAADLGSQFETFSSEMDPDKVKTGKEIGVLALAARETALPLDLLGKGGLIVTSMKNVDGVVTVDWQRRWGRTDFASRISPSAMKGVVLANGESAIYAEIAYRFDPYLLSKKFFKLSGEGDVRTSAVRKARLAGSRIT